MIRAIIFDCFGVLATDVWLAFCDGLPPSADIERARDLNRAIDRGMISRAEYIEGVREATGETPPDIETMELTKNTALIAYIAELKDQFKIGLLSNISSDWITRELLNLEEQKLFDAMVLSYEVGMTKPEPRIYELVCDQLGVSASDALFVDDREGYVRAAQDIGMNGITYQNLTQFKSELAPFVEG